MLFRAVLFVIFLSHAPFAHAGMIDYPTVKLQTLDKSTARTITLEAKVGTTVEYGSIFIKVQACRKSEPLDKPESAAFLQIWEVPLNSKKSEWVFSGWMFASSPALSAMDHAVYDVWVLDCIGKTASTAQVSKTTIETAAPDALETPDADSAITVEEDESLKPRIVIENDVDDIIEDLTADEDALDEETVVQEDEFGFE